LLLWTVAAILVGVTGSGVVDAQSASANRWRWLNNTYWYVPNQYLLAIASNPSVGAPLPVSDQTVYYISNYKAGYFWGTTAVTYYAANSEPSSPSCLQLVGSVTPEGELHLTFTPLSSTDPQPTIGIGTMTLQGGAWTMENQMSTEPAGNLLLTHWAYMFQCSPGQPCYRSLPGVKTSIPDFLSPCLTQPPG
ncbi:MAG TPA: hypothetical protein VMB26_01600, partial [Candidatus Binataceae bacterium]|nr:hypothetical protein [Candidatus Binataceae bacterium]